MLKKIKGFAITNTDGEFLVFEQVGDSDIEIHSTDNVEYATLFPTQEMAHTEGYNVKFGIGNWNYLTDDDCIPANIVKIKKVIEREKVEKII